MKFIGGPRVSNRIYYLANKEKILARCKTYRETNILSVRETIRKWRERQPPESLKERSRLSYLSNPNPEVRGKWARNNPEKRREVARQWAARWRATINGTLDHRMSVAIGSALKGEKNGRRWESLVGYSMTELKRHLEQRFTKGMSWKKLLAGEIHIDHVIPKSKYNYETTNDPQFKQCWALTNLQPLWWSKNFSKGQKILNPSQISLPL